MDRGTMDFKRAQKCIINAAFLQVHGEYVNKVLKAGLHGFDHVLAIGVHW